MNSFGGEKDDIFVGPAWQEVEVRPSSVADAGSGLFALRPFEAGEKVCDYRGKVLSLAQAMRLENRDYLMGGFGLNVHVDASEAYSIPGRYVNDSGDVSRINAKFVKHPELRKATVVAIRRIESGDEIFASYGETYWRCRREKNSPI